MLSARTVVKRELVTITIEQHEKFRIGLKQEVTSNIFS